MEKITAGQLRRPRICKLPVNTEVVLHPCGCGEFDSPVATAYAQAAESRIQLTPAGGKKGSTLKNGKWLGEGSWKTRPQKRSATRGQNSV